MTIEVSKAQAQFLIEAVEAKPVTLSFGQVMKGLNVGSEIKDLLSALTAIVEHVEPVEVAPAQAEEPTPTETQPV